MLAGLVSVEGCEAESVLCLSPSFWEFPASLGVLQLVDARLQPLPPSSMAIFLCVLTSSSYRHQAHWAKSTSYPIVNAS